MSIERDAIMLLIGMAAGVTVMLITASMLSRAVVPKKEDQRAIAEMEMLEAEEDES